MGLNIQRWSLLSVLEGHFKINYWVVHWITLVLTWCIVIEISSFLSQRERQSRFLMMGKKPSNPGEDLKLTFMIPWTKSKVCFIQERIYNDNVSFVGDQASKTNVQIYGLWQPKRDITEDDCGHVCSRNQPARRKWSQKTRFTWQQDTCFWREETQKQITCVNMGWNTVNHKNLGTSSPLLNVG